MQPPSAASSSPTTTASTLQRWSARAALATRLFLGLVFFTGGMSKLLPFPGVMGPVWLEDELAPYGLGAWARFVAWSEAVIGLFVLSPRFATLGLILLVPMVANILMVTISLRWRGTPYVVGVFLAMNLWLLARERQRWKFLFAADDAPLERVPVPGAPRARELRYALSPLLVLAGVPLHAVAPMLAYALIALGLASTLVARPSARQ